MTLTKRRGEIGMDVIETRIDINSAIYKTNYQEMTALVDELKQQFPNGL